MKWKIANNENDITNKHDIELLVNTFYDKVKTNKIIIFFNDVAKVDWEHHLPKMYSFWASLLSRTQLFGKSYAETYCIE
ncbi:MAG: group III truncated hemoglobin [Flavobacteriaceae bacterium]